MSDSMQLKMCTYNIHGFNVTKVDYISALLNKYSLVFIEEHWLSNDQLGDITQHFPGHGMHGVSAINDGVLLQGRPHGGCLVLFHDSLCTSITTMTVSSKRICALCININGFILYIFCVYMPCDVNHVDNLEEYNNVLNEICQICFRYNAENICIVGDINTDLSRSNSWHTQSLLQFIESEELLYAIHHNTANVNYTYVNEFYNTRSTIDHFILSPSLFDIITEYYSICDDIDNFSDHCPLVLSLEIDLQKYKASTINYKPRKKWSTANRKDIASYQMHMDDCLYNICLPIDCLQCSDLLCMNTCHRNSIHTLHDNIISAILSASDEIPETKITRIVPGWNEFVKEKRITALFWLNIWRENNSPEMGAIADVMRFTRNQYHYSVRHVKRNNETIKKQNLAKAISENNSREFWKEVNKTRKNNTPNASSIDNVTSNDGIAQLFANKYNELYNSVRYNNVDLNTIIDHNVNDIAMHCMNDNNNNHTCTKHIHKHTHIISIEQIQFAITKLKSGKGDCIDGIMSDNFKNGTDMLYLYISLLFNCMLCHGIVPEDLTLSTMVPIPKNKRASKCDSNNYRAIAISSILGKILDLIIIEEQHNSLTTDVLQFGYKANSSTIVCTALLLETINYYKEHKTDSYLLLLDASKAFDRVEYVKLFTLLYERCICPVVLRLIMNMYVNQKIQVRWNQTMSSKYTISNGVKQGGVLSPILYSVYTDNLIQILRKSNIGCRYNNQYMGIYGYADDISLLCPTLTGLQKMLDICENYANNYNITFNAKKSQLLYFSYNNETASNYAKLSMKNGNSIPYVSECTYLGTKLYTDVHCNVVNNAVQELNRKTNYLLADFSFSKSETLSKLYNSYCMNMYGSQLWQYNKLLRMSPLYIAWRKCIRRIWRLHYRTHNELIHHINNSLPIDIILEKRCIKFIWNLMNSEYPLFVNIVKYSLNNSNTVIGENARYFMYKYKMSYKDWYSPIHIIYRKIDTYVTNNRYNISHTGITIRGLCDVRDGGSLDNFNINEVKSMIELLCTR